MPSIVVAAPFGTAGVSPPPCRVRPRRGATLELLDLRHAATLPPPLLPPPWQCRHRPQVAPERGPDGARRRVIPRANPNKHSHNQGQRYLTANSGSFPGWGRRRPKPTQRGRLVARARGLGRASPPVATAAALSIGPSTAPAQHLAQTLMMCQLRWTRRGRRMTWRPRKKPRRWWPAADFHARRVLAPAQRRQWRRPCAALPVAAPALVAVRAVTAAPRLPTHHPPPCSTF